MPHVRAGVLRSRIDILAPNGTQTPGGGLDPETPITVASRIPAAVTSAPAGETLQVGALQSAVASLVRIRYQPGIAPYMQVILDGRTLQILSIVDVDNLHATLELTCTEVQ